MSFLSPELQAKLEQTWLFIPNLIVAIITFGVTLVVSSIAARWAKRAVRLRNDDPEIQELMSRLARWSVLVLGTILALEQVDFDVTSFLAGLGIVGFTIGFALQDIARNFVAGILLLLRQPFDIGEAVTVGSTYSGQVMEINTRDTVIKTWDGEQVILPNIDIFSNPIINYSKVKYRRRTVYIGLGYGEDPDRAIEIFLDTIKSLKCVQDDPPPTVRAEELGNSAMQLAARFWVDQKTHNLFEVHSKVVIAIQNKAEEAGIDLPYPIQTVRLEKQ